MAPKRRTTTPRNATRQQSTLSFGGKSKITKPSSPRTNKTAQKDAALLEDIANADLEPTIAEKVIAQQTEEEIDTLDDPLQSRSATAEDILGGRAEQSDVGAVGGKGSGWVGDEETTARKISDAQIKTYWRQKEQERKAPRIHQQDLSVHQKVLREWDMSGQYGPCIGIARLKRWKRANVLGLNPPIEVLAVLLKELEGGDVKSQRAYVDELMSSRFVET